MASGPSTKKIRILFLAANALDEALLKLNEEYESIKDEISAAGYGKAFELEAVLSTDLNRLIRALLTHRPHIVHFSGHGSSQEEILLQTSPEIEAQLRNLSPVPSRQTGAHPLGKRPLVQILEAIKDQVRLVVLNACYSSTQAKELTTVVDYVVGIKSAISDETARIFSTAFYQALAFNRSVPQAFNLARAKLSALGLPDHDLPSLYMGKEVDVSLTLLDTKDLAQDGSNGESHPLGVPPPSRHVVLRAAGSPLKLICNFRKAVHLGRSPTCDVALSGAPDDVGNSHALITYWEARNSYQIADLTSANGTFVNDERVQPRQALELRTGDEVRLGRSLRLLFRADLDEATASTAALVRLDSEARELDSFVIAPRERLLIGNTPRCVARIPPPLLAEGEAVGELEWTPGGIYFRPKKGQEGRQAYVLKDGDEISLPHLTLQVEITRKPTADSAAATVHYEVPEKGVDSSLKKPVRKPDSGEVPPWLRKLDAMLACLGLVIAPLVFYFTRPEPRAAIVAQWMERCRHRLQAGKGEGWKLAEGEKLWPPPRPIYLSLVASDSDLTEYQSVIDRASPLGTFPEAQIQQLPRPQPERFSTEALTEVTQQAVLLVKFSQQRWGSTALEVSYFQHFDPKVQPDFLFASSESVLTHYSYSLMMTILVLATLGGVRPLSVQWYRHRRWMEYEAWQAKQTAESYHLKSLLDEARKLIHGDKNAQALILLNQILERKPSYDEAAELKRLIQAGIGAARATLMSTDTRPHAETQVPADVPNLFLKILQTPYAYRAPQGFDRISLGRQRRHESLSEEAPHSPKEAGNDLVIRVPGSDRLSLRISRRHLEIQRIDKDFYVKDLSGGQTALNGRSLIKGKPCPIISGDRLTIAGVLVLQVQFQATVAGKALTKIIQVQQAQGAMFEATIGDLVTELPHE
jgi:pSer/pThr/pTyr-binding forkhead associated (FHA) protein